MTDNWRHLIASKFRDGATCIRIFTNETSGQQQGHQLGAHGSDKKGKCFLWHFESRTEKGQMLKMSEGETFQSGIVVSKEKILRFYFLSISWSLSRSSSARPTMKRTWSFPIDLGSTTTTNTNVWSLFVFCSINYTNMCPLFPF